MPSRKEISKKMSIQFKSSSCYSTVNIFWVTEKFITFLCKLRGIRDHKHCLNNVCVRSFQFLPTKNLSMPFNFNLISTILPRKTFFRSSNRFVFKLSSLEEFLFYFPILSQTWSNNQYSTS